MSAETYEWLNQQCLIGFTDKRGRAWHYKESAQGTEPNHYPGPIPIEEVQRRLFSWQAIEQPIFIRLPRGGFVTVPNKKAIVASDNNDVLGVFSDGYTPHQYDEWLLKNVATILDGDLGIGSALLLRNRGVAVVQVELPDSITTPDGVEFRPNVVAATSFDGSLSTLYKAVSTNVVCDNTFSGSLREEGREFRLRHSRYSTLKVGEARDALQIIFDAGEAFTAQVGELVATTVTEAQWQSVLNALVPVPKDKGRSQTIAVNKRNALQALWTSDPRVEPWTKTAWGVTQAFNTYGQHVATVKGAHRVERNFDNVLNGKSAAADLKVIDVLGAILDKELIGA